MIELNNFISYSHLPPPAPRMGLMPASVPGQASGSNPETGNRQGESQKQPEENENMPENEPDRPCAPITPASAGARNRKTIPLQEDINLIDPNGPEHALRRRARAYERMMLYY